MAAGAGEADFKSNVLSRDEKGFLGIPFKRLVVAGVGGGLIYSCTKIVFGDLAIPIGIVSCLIILIMTSLRGGIPRWERMLYQVRGSLTIAMVDNPDSITARIGKMLDLSPDYIVLHSEKVFTAPDDAAEIEVDWSDWVTFSEARHAKRGNGLVIVEGPKPRLLTASTQGVLPKGRSS